MKKMTSKNYEDQIWCDVEYGEEVWYSRYFKYCEVAWCAKKFGVQVLPSETPNTVRVVAMTRRSNIKTGYTFNP